MTFLYVYIYKKCLQKKKKTLWKVDGFCNRTSRKVPDVQIIRETWVLSSFSLSVLCVVCCCSARGGGGGGGRRGREGKE